MWAVGDDGNLKDWLLGVLIGRERVCQSNFKTMILLGVMGIEAHGASYVGLLFLTGVLAEEDTLCASEIAEKCEEFVDCQSGLTGME
jgi:hypothetical protein